MAVVDEPDESCARAPSLPLGSEVPLSEADVRDLFPRTVRPVVFKASWAVLLLLLVVLVVLVFRYYRSFG